MKVLITGANGQLGRAFKKVWPEAISLDREKLDLSWDNRRIIEVVKSIDPDIMINCAAYTKVDQAEREVDIAERINKTAVGTLANICNELDSTLIHFSTDYIFDGIKSSPYKENDLPNPQSVYGQTKLGGEKKASLANKHLIIRLSYVFGDGSNLVTALISAAERFPEIKAINDQTIRPTYAVDVAQAVKILLEKDIELPLLLHLQNEGDPVSIADLAREIYKMVGKDIPVKEVTLDEYFAGREVTIRPKYSVFDLSLAHDLGITMPDWRKALAHYLKTI